MVEPFRMVAQYKELYSKDNTATANRSTRLRHASGSYKKLGGEVQ